MQSLLSQFCLLCSTVERAVGTVAPLQMNSLNILIMWSQCVENSQLKDVPLGIPTLNRVE